jgi:hypothetical protein
MPLDAAPPQTTVAAATPALPMLPLVLPMALGMAAIATGGILASQPIEPVQFHVQIGAGAVTVATAGACALAGLYAGSLWHRARRLALRMEQAPKPDYAPRRRALYGSQAVRPQAVRLDPVSLLRADFAAVATANPERRVEDQSAFLRRVAKRCCGAAIALTAVAATVLLAA